MTTMDIFSARFVVSFIMDRHLYALENGRRFLMPHGCLLPLYGDEMKAGVVGTIKIIACTLHAHNGGEEERKGRALK
jgi:hypothetical protein